MAMIIRSRTSPKFTNVWGSLPRLKCNGFFRDTEIRSAPTHGDIQTPPVRSWGNEMSTEGRKTQDAGGTIVLSASVVHWHITFARIYPFPVYPISATALACKGHMSQS